jgi:hypothetical protein
MIAVPHSPCCRLEAERLQAGFVNLLPRIERHARVYFRHVKCPHRKADSIAETVALAWRSYVLLARRGKAADRFPGALACFAARAVRSGRRLCGQAVLAVDAPRALNKVRYITEKVLRGLCAARGVSWDKDGKKEPTLENMFGPLKAAGHIPGDVAVHLRTVQNVASPGSHYQTAPLSVSHVEIGLVALGEVLRWHAGLSRAAVPGPTPGKLGNVPELPPHFLPRPEQLQALKDALIGGDRPRVAITGQGRVGVQGMGGIGKSVLAAAVAREPEVRAAFADGVLWVTVGQDPKLSLLQEELARQLDDRAGGFESLEHGKRCLRTLLADRSCLVVLDDVWDAGHADAFAVLGPRCRLLLTTRDAAVLTTLGAEEHRLDVLDDEQARRLLADWSGQGAADLPAEARAVARQCGNLPLALAVCGAMARDGIAWHDLRDALRDADLSFLDRQLPGYPHRDVLRCLRTSVAYLTQADPQAAGCYGQLAVFPKDEAVPEAAVLALWQHGTGLKERQARKLLSLLERRGLLRLGGEAPNRRVSLHDLQHDYLRVVHEDPAALHGRLLAAYRQQCRDGWPGGPNDGYFFEHLAHHLKEAGQRDALLGLLLDCGWLRARLAATGVPGLLADYEQLPDDADLRLVQGAVRLSAHVLARDPAQLGGQLLGRLLRRLRLPRRDAEGVGRG